MDFLGIGIPELILILVIALIVVGPDRLPEVAAQLGRTVRQIRRYTTEVSGQFREEFDSLTREYELMQEDLRRTQQELRDLRDELRQDAASASQEFNESVEGVRQDLIGPTAVESSAMPAVTGRPEPAEEAEDGSEKVIPIDSVGRRAASSGAGQTDTTDEPPQRRPPSTLSGV